MHLSNTMTFFLMMGITFITILPGYADTAVKPQASTPSEPLVLVHNGACGVSIHNLAVGAPSTVEIFAAEQLQEAFQLACGVGPPINPDSPADIEIRLGVADRFKVGVGDENEQAYAVRRTADDDIELVGNCGAAVMWAAADFCKEVLGVSWPHSTDVMMLGGGQKATLSVAHLSKVEAPDFPVRGWIIGANIHGYHYSDTIGKWMAHNRQNTLHTRFDLLYQNGTDKQMWSRGIDIETTMHTFGVLIPASLYYDKPEHPESYHPEYFPLIDGKRVRPKDEASIYLQLCLSNHEVFEIAHRNIVEGFAQRPDLNVFGVGQNDGPGGWCECSHCVEMDGAQAGTGVYSNRLIRFVNSLGEAIASSHPGKYVGTFAGGTPPDVNVADNVALTFVFAGGNYMRKITDAGDPHNAGFVKDLKGWLSKSKNVHLWAHYWTMSVDSCRAPYARTVVDSFGELKQLGLRGICGETRPPYWPGQRLFFYAMARAGWDTSLNFDTILDDYCRETYGPAASAMKSHYLLYESRIYEHVPVLLRDGAAAQLFPPAFSSADIDTLERYIAGAEVAAAGGTQGNLDAVAEVREMFEKFRKVGLDPRDIPGIGPNLVQNPGAENGSAGRSFNDLLDQGDYTAGIASGGAHTGSKSLKIECTGKPGQAARWYKEIPVTPGKRYAGSFWIRASGGAYGRLEVASSPPVLPVGWVDSNDQWVRIVVPEFAVAPTRSSITIYATNNAGGTVYFDDFFIAELPANRELPNGKEQ